MGRSVMISALRVLRSVVLGYVIATLVRVVFCAGVALSVHGEAVHRWAV